MGAPRLKPIKHNGKVLTGAERAAVLLIALGEEIAASLLAKLPELEMRRVALAMRSVGRIDDQTVRAVIDEFAETLHSPKGISGGNEKAKKILERAFSATEARDYERVLGLDFPSGIPALQDVDPEALARYLLKEHPQTGALVAAHLDPQKFKDTCHHLPKSLRSEILLRVARLDFVDPEQLEAIDEAIAQLNHQTSVKIQGVGGVEAVAKLLSGLDPEAAEKMMADLEERDPDLLAKVREHLFPFDDIVNLDDKSVQVALKRISRSDLLLSLRTANDAIKAKFARNMSEGARKLLEEDLAAAPKARRDDIASAQKRITRMLLELKEQGVIAFDSPDEYV